MRAKLANDLGTFRKNFGKNEMQICDITRGGKQGKWVISIWQKWNTN